MPLAHESLCGSSAWECGADKSKMAFHTQKYIYMYIYTYSLTPPPSSTVNPREYNAHTLRSEKERGATPTLRVCVCVNNKKKVKKKSLRSSLQNILLFITLEMHHTIMKLLLLLLFQITRWFFLLICCKNNNNYTEILAATVAMFIYYIRNISLRSSSDNALVFRKKKK